MRRLLSATLFLGLAASALAQRVEDVNGRHVQLYPDKDHAQGWAKPGGGGAQNIAYHGGPVIHQAKVVSIFWGSEWGTTTASPSVLAQNIMLFFAQFGGTGEYNVITQYGDGGGLVQKTNLTNNYWVDTVNPPTNVTDAAIQAEVVNYLNANTSGAADASTIYEVFLPSTSYASFGTSTSCGGPNLQFCAYHSSFGHGVIDVKYSSMPYPGCGGCHWTGFTVEQDFDHFACHETREAVTDPDGNAWFDRRGSEADDKCAWSPAPFIGTGGFGYQWEWSNAVSACVKTR
ncbi:MAG TPA: hypothetical protein VGS00_06165 [Thermoanaerobaculia bacterium]|nr:hypothetical protein [Thermoanaerobaculia bacterium]